MFIQKIKKGWQELYEEVIQTGKCVYCGACGAFCANIKFDREKEVPIEDGSCKDMNTCRDGYGLCYNLCPKTEIDLIPISLLDKWVFGIRSERILGHYIDIKSVKLTEKALGKFPSNAGPLTALLYVAMENGLIDASIITDKDGDFKPIPIIAESPKDLLKGVGYKPSQSPTISLIGEAINKEHSDIAVVGTPCQIQALRKLQTHPTFDYEAYDLVTLAIGTFCTGTYYNKILSEIFLKNGIKDSEIEQIDTDKNNFTLKIRTNSLVKEIPLNYLYDNAIRKACFSCSDYTASFADISVGNFGSEIGWDTTIIRTERGKKVFELAIEKEIITAKSLDKDDEELILDLTRTKTDIVKIESVIEHSPKIKSFFIRNQRIAKAYKPGMFVILWLLDIDFLPMSISKIDGNLIEITVERIGEGTSKLFDLVQGDLIGIRGPYGNTWNYEDAENILIVGGGMGIAALTSLIEPLKKNKKNVFIAIGAKDEPSLIFSDRLIDLIPNTLCTTDDGSVGKKCFVTDTIEDIIKKEKIDLILTCGPEVMMKRVLEIANSNNIEIQASLERKMKCGVGLCGSCCIGEKNNITVCKEGPIFDSTQLKSFPQFGKYSKE
ncbi:MAG: dihydroorotate dehydrogenase electron transfer subunit [Promethearchaeota archaeon]